jgi:YD repeat-containing protein
LTKESESTHYNAFGDVDYTIDFNGAKVDPVYDYEVFNASLPVGPNNSKLGRTAWTEYRDGANVLQAKVDPTYDVYGRVDTIEEWTPLGVRLTDHDYDFEGRLSKVTRPEGWVGYGYEESTGRLVELSTSLSQTKYTYDKLGRTKTVEEHVRNGTAFPAPVVTSYGYAKDSLVELVKYSYGSTHYRDTVHIYDPERRWLDSVTNKDVAGVTASRFVYTRRYGESNRVSGRVFASPDSSRSSARRDMLSPCPKRSA